MSSSPMIPGPDFPGSKYPIRNSHCTDLALSFSTHSSMVWLSESTERSKKVSHVVTSTTPLFVGLERRLKTIGGYGGAWHRPLTRFFRFHGIGKRPENPGSKLRTAHWHQRSLMPSILHTL